MTCADTSFLFSLYGADSGTAKARARMANQSQALTIHPLNDAELVNAVHLSVFRKAQPASDGDKILRAWQADTAARRLVLHTLPLADVVTETVRLAGKHTRKHGYRIFDIMHVASALLLGADTFLSFDKDQRALAKAEGLIVGP
jgi:predicted nucleic acid-binding protein